MNSFPSDHFISIFRPQSTGLFSAVIIAGITVLPCIARMQNAQAQNSPELTATYGRGVHAYFANQTLLAEQHFSRVILTGSKDPRVYYFRAMTRMHSGRQSEAEDDMRTGASLEARNPGSRHSIGMALERLQGRGRRTLEQFRRQARLDREQQRQQQSQLRYEQLKQRESAVLRHVAPVRLEQLVEPSAELTGPAPVPSVVPQPAIPSNNQEDPSSPKPSLAPAADKPAPEPSAVPEEDDLFASPVPQPDSSEEDSGDPFGEPSTPIQPSPLPESVELEEDPFGDLGPAEDKPVDDDSDDDSTPSPAEDSDSEASSPDLDAAEDDPFAVSEPAPAPVEPVDVVAEPVETDDSDTAASLPADPSDGNLTASDKVKSGKLVGILGRVVGRAMPWHGVRLPAFTPPKGIPGAADSSSVGDLELELGPSIDSRPDEGQVDSDVSSQEPAAMAEEDDLFGDSSDDDPFADTEEEIEEETDPASSSGEDVDTAESSDDDETLEEDLFGEF